MATGTRNVDHFSFVHALKEAVAASAAPTYVSLKGYDHISILVPFKNATGVTGSAITLNQATAVAPHGCQAAAAYYRVRLFHDSVSVAVVQTPVVNNTFTTDATASKSGFYVIEVDAITLDVANGYDCLQLGVGNGTAATSVRGIRTVHGPATRTAMTSLMNPLVDFITWQPTSYYDHPRCADVTAGVR